MEAKSSSSSDFESQLEEEILDEQGARTNKDSAVVKKAG